MKHYLHGVFERSNGIFELFLVPTLPGKSKTFSHKIALKIVFEMEVNYKNKTHESYFRPPKYYFRADNSPHTIPENQEIIYLYQFFFFFFFQIA